MIEVKNLVLGVGLLLRNAANSGSIMMLRCGIYRLLGWIGKHYTDFS